MNLNPLSGLQEEIVSLRQNNAPVKELSKRYKVSRQAIYNILKKAEKEGSAIPWVKREKSKKLCKICNKKVEGCKKTCSLDCLKKYRQKKASEKSSNWSKHSYLDLKCEKCGKDFKRTKYQNMISMKGARKNAPKRNYCSLSCYRGRNFN